MISFKGMPGMRRLSADSVGAGMVMVIFSGIAPFLLFFMSWSSQRVCLSWLVTVARGPGAFLWHGWLPGLCAAGERAASLGQLADGSLEQALGASPVCDAGFWTRLDF